MRGESPQEEVYEEKQETQKVDCPNANRQTEDSPLEQGGLELAFQLAFAPPLPDGKTQVELAFFWALLCFRMTRLWDHGNCDTDRARSSVNWRVEATGVHVFS